MRRFLLAMLAVGALSLPGLGLGTVHAQYGYHSHSRHSHGHYNQPRVYYQPYHYDYYRHGDHIDAVPHVGGHGHGYGHGHSHYEYRSYRPNYGQQYRGYGHGGVNLPGVSVRW